MTRHKITAMLAGAAFLAISAPALAATHQGTVSIYHLNGNVVGRGVCIQTFPAMPNTWACLWKSNPLYAEITAMLLEGFISGKSCTLYWNSVDASGHNVLFAAECR